MRRNKHKADKSHLYFHIIKYIEIWRCPKGWNAASNENNNKMMLKPQLKYSEESLFY